MTDKDAIRVTRLLSAPRALVFKAWTDPVLMTRWFFLAEGWTAQVRSDLRVGGQYEVVMLDTDGVRHVQTGEYRQIVPDSRLQFTWTCRDVGVEDSLVTVTLEERGDQTELVLTHELPADPKIREAHDHGWQGCLASLERYLTQERGK